MLIVGADPEGSVYTADEAHPLHPYLVEGIGKDTWPRTMDPDVVDEWIRVSDRDSFLTARRLAREEGLLVGGSGGSTVWAALELAKRLGPAARILSVIPDSGRSYLSKFYDDAWMLQYGFLERSAPPPTVEQVLRYKRGEAHDVPDLVTIEGNRSRRRDRPDAALLDLAAAGGRDGRWKSLAHVSARCRSASLLDRVFTTRDALQEDVAIAMLPPLAAVDATASLDQVSPPLGPHAAVVVAAAVARPAILTRSTCSSTWRTAGPSPPER